MGTIRNFRRYTHNSRDNQLVSGEGGEMRRRESEQVRRGESERKTKKRHFSDGLLLFLTFPLSHFLTVD